MILLSSVAENYVAIIKQSLMIQFSRSVLPVGRHRLKRLHFIRKHWAGRLLYTLALSIYSLHSLDRYVIMETVPLLPPISAKSGEIRRKFELIAVQGRPRSSILVSIESACNFLLVINSNFGWISDRFESYWRLGVGPIENNMFPHLSLVWRPSSRGTR